tara:strand:- start:3993 stop:5027 length:1035 start_codon:yes stop_codon:yes gene_type:complete
MNNKEEHIIEIKDFKIIDKKIIDKNIIDKNIIDKSNNKIKNNISELENTDINQDNIYKIQNKYNKCKCINSPVKLSYHIAHKVNMLDKRTKYINYKFKVLRIHYKMWSISIIVIASILTLSEAVKNTLDIEELVNDKNTIKQLNMMPLIIGSILTLIASIVKFNRYEERIDKISKTSERCRSVISKLKSINEDLHFCDNKKEFDTIITMYRYNVYKDYLECSLSLNKYLYDEKKYTKFLQKIIKNYLTKINIMFDKDKKIDTLKKQNNIKINYTTNIENDDFQMLDDDALYRTTNQNIVENELDEPSFINTNNNIDTRHNEPYIAIVDDNSYNAENSNENTILN